MKNESVEPCHVLYDLQSVILGFNIFRTVWLTFFQEGRKTKTLTQLLKYSRKGTKVGAKAVTGCRLLFCSHVRSQN